MKQGDYVIYKIMQNSNEIDSKILTASGSKALYQCDQTFAVAVLQVNQTVWINCYTHSGSIYQDSNAWNSFSGYLIHN